MTDVLTELPSEMSRLVRNPFAANGWAWRRTHTPVRRVVKPFAWTRQEPKRRERFQVQPARYRKSRSRLIGAQGKFHRRPKDPVDLFVIEPVASEPNLCREDYIPLHAGRCSFKRRAGKDSSW